MDPTSFADIAPEILESIFGFLKPLDLTQCQLVCNKWSRMAQEQLYKNVKGFSSAEKFNSFLETINSSPSNPNSYVKSLDIWPLSTHLNERGYEKNLMSRRKIHITREKCPKIESFHAYRTYVVWNGITSEVKSGNFKHLKITPSLTDKHYLAYAHTAVALSKNLESLHISFPNIKLMKS